MLYTLYRLYTISPSLQGSGMDANLQSYKKGPHTSFNIGIYIELNYIDLQISLTDDPMKTLHYRDSENYVRQFNYGPIVYRSGL